MVAGCSATSWQRDVTSGASNLWSGATRLLPGGGWAADYEHAEQLAAESGQGILFLFTAKDRTRKDGLRDFLENPAERGVAGDYVSALLFHKNETDRRYAAQFGVYRAPSVIVWHPDGTYHATQGSLSPEIVSKFLAQAVPPGSPPTINPLVARRVGYAWHRDWESARRVAKESGKPVFVVLERWMSRDWDTLRPMLERPEVYSRMAGMIHCRPATTWSTSSAAATELEIKSLPAIAIVDSNGTVHRLEMPSSYEAIVRFADQARQEVAATAQEGVQQ